jgi:hypothetical protein
MAASSLFAKHCNTLNDELLTTKLAAVAGSITSTLTSRLRRLPPALLGSSWWCRWSTAWNKASEALEVLLRQRHCQCLKT